MMQPAPNPHAEAHLTLVHGSELLHACSAAVNAETLRSADPERARIAFAWRLSAESREVLSYGWQLRESDDAVVGTLLDTESGRKAVVLDATLAGHKQPLSRAMFWDADHMVLPSSTRLKLLWDVRRDAEILAYPESSGCWNTGFMLFRPSRLRRKEYERLLAATAEEARGRYRRGDRRCVVTKRCWRNPCQPNDQSYLNAVYSSKSGILQRLRASGGGAGAVNAYAEANGMNRSVRGRYLPVPGSALRMRTSTRFGAQYGSRSCLVNVQQLRRSDDTFHFYARLAPWRGACAACALGGRRCSYASLPNFNAELGTDESGAAHTCGRAAAQQIWFETLREKLPRRLRSLCLARLEVATANATGVCLDKGQLLTWPRRGARA